MKATQRKSTFRTALCGAIVALLVAAPFSAANARWLEKSPPALPVGVYLQGMEGSVVLSLVLDRAGHVTDTSVLKSSGFPALDTLAQTAAMHWRLSPDSVVASDLSQGRVEKVQFRNSPTPSRLMPGAKPYWAWVR